MHDCAWLGVVSLHPPACPQRVILSLAVSSSNSKQTPLCPMPAILSPPRRFGNIGLSPAFWQVMAAQCQVQILARITRASNGNASALSTTQRPLNLISGRECTFVGCKVGENNPTVTMLRAKQPKQQMLQRSICWQSNLFLVVKCTKRRVYYYGKWRGSTPGT